MRIAEGRGTKRERIRVKVAVYGNIQPPLDQDELNAASLNPKYRLYPRVKKDNVKLNMRAGETKKRWGRINKLLDGQGNIVLEVSEQKSDV